jgi:hypothetical protein
LTETATAADSSAVRLPAQKLTAATAAAIVKNFNFIAFSCPHRRLTAWMRHLQQCRQGSFANPKTGIVPNLI